MADEIKQKLIFDITDFKNSISQMNQGIRIAKNNFTAAAGALGDWRKSYEGIETRIKSLNDIMTLQRAKVDALSSEYEELSSSGTASESSLRKLQEQISKANAELGRTEGQMKEATDAQDKFGDETDDAANALDKYGNEIEDAGKKTSKFGDFVKKAGSVMKSGLVASAKAVGASMTAIGVAAGAAAKWVGDSLNVYANFEDSMKQVQATMGLVGEEGIEAFDKLSAAAKQAGSTTRFSASESADALNYLALAGYNADDAISALPGVLTLAQAGNLDLAAASDMVTDSMAALGIAAEDMGSYMDMMAKTSQKSNTNVAQLGEAILVAGGTMKNAGQDLDTINVMLGVLANRGIKGAEGGTKLRNIMMSLTSPTSAAAAELQNLGLSVTDSEGNIREMNDIFIDLSESLDGLSESDKTNALNNIFNKQDMAGVSALIAGVGDEVNSLYVDLENSNGAAQQMAETMEDSLGGSVRGLKSAYEGLQIVVGEQFADVAKDAVGDVTDMVRDITDVLSDGFQAGDIEKIGNRISKFLIDGIKQIVEYVPELIAVVQELLSSLVDIVVGVLPTLVPILFDAAIQLIQGLMDAIMANLQPLMDTVVYLVEQFALFFLESLPVIVDIAIQLVLALAKGIVDVLPALIPAAVDAIMTIVNSLLDNLPMLIEAAIAIVLALLDGLIESLPRLIAWLPTIIESIIDGVVGALPMLIDASIEIIIALIEGLIKALPALIEAAPEIISAIVSGMIQSTGLLIAAVPELFSALWDGFTQMDWGGIGKNLIEGIGNGISNAAGSLVDAARNAAKRALDSVKSFLKIGSPSKLFEDEVGVNIGLGVAEGITNTTSDVSRSMKNVTDKLKDDVRIDKNISVNGAVSGQGTVGGSALLQIENFYNNTDKDIERLAYDFEFARQRASAAIGG